MSKRQKKKFKDFSDTMQGLSLYFVPLLAVVVYMYWGDSVYLRSGLLATAIIFAGVGLFASTMEYADDSVPFWGGMGLSIVIVLAGIFVPFHFLQPNQRAHLEDLYQHGVTTTATVTSVQLKDIHYTAGVNGFSVVPFEWNAKAADANRVLINVTYDHGRKALIALNLSPSSDTQREYFAFYQQIQATHTLKIRYLADDPSIVAPEELLLGHITIK